MREHPMQLWTFTYWHPSYRNHVTLDCPARSVDLALDKARRWIAGVNATLRGAKVTRYVPPPVSFVQMRHEWPTKRLAAPPRLHLAPLLAD